MVIPVHVRCRCRCARQALRGAEAASRCRARGAEPRASGAFRARPRAPSGAARAHSGAAARALDAHLRRICGARRPPARSGEAARVTDSRRKRTPVGPRLAFRVASAPSKHSVSIRVGGVDFGAHRLSARACFYSARFLTFQSGKQTNTLQNKQACEPKVGRN